MGSFKAKYNLEQNDWMLSHLAKKFTIYNLVESTGQAFHKSFTIKNIGAGLKKNNVYLFNRNALSEDFDEAKVTDLSEKNNEAIDHI